MKFAADGTMTISLTVTVDIPDEDLEGLTEAEIQDLVKERAYEADAKPSDLCIHCSGYTSTDRTEDGSSFDLELDGEWKIASVRASE